MSALTGIQKIVLTTLVVVLAGGAVFFFQSRAGTFINFTLTSNPNLERGLVGHWTFDGEYMDWGSTTAEVRDRSGNGNHGNASSSMSASAEGKIGQGIEFHGVNDGAVITQNSTINDLNTLTLSAWIRHNDADNSYYDRILNKTEAFIMYVNGGVLYLEANRWDGYPGIWRTTVNVPTGEWIHVTATYDYGNPTNDPIFYYNGAVVNQIETHTPSGTSLGETNDLILGNSDFGERVFNGTMDDIRIYNRVLSVDEIKRLYQLGATTKVAQTLNSNTTLETGLVLHYTFDGQDIDYSSTTAEIRDRSGNSLHGNWINHASTTVPGVLGQAINIQQGSEPYSCVRNASSSLVSALGPMSMGVWVKDTIGGMALFEVGNSNPTLTLALQGADLKFTRRYSTSDLSKEAVPTFSMHTSEWTHYVVTWDGTTASTGVKIYGNGARITSDGYAFDGSGTPYSLGGIVHVGCNMFNDQGYEGPMDDLRIYNRTLSDDEVKRLYQLGATTKIAQTLDSNTTLETGLVGHWTFDGNDVDWSSTTAEVRDRSGNANHGNASGGMSAQSAVEGRVGQAMAFDGTDDLLYFGAVDVLDNVANLSLSFWLKPESYGGGIQGRIFSKTYDCCDPSAGWLIQQYGTSETIQFKADFDGGILIADAPGTHPPSDFNTWTHWVVTWDGSSATSGVSIYKNSVPLAVSGTSGGGNRVDDSTSSVRINEPGGTRAIDGNLDDIRVYNHILSADEVKRLYEMGN